MAITLKTAREVEAMRRAGALAVRIIEKMTRAVRPGIATQALDDVARHELIKAGAVSTAKNYPTYREGEGFPGYFCTSVNEEVVHAPPGPRRLREGDILTLDLTVRLHGHCASRAVTIPVGSIAPDRQRLLKTAEDALALAVEQIRPGRPWSEVARLIQHSVEGSGYNVVREFVGHGIGRQALEDPMVPNVVTGRGDFVLRPGITLTVEPMVLSGGRGITLLGDGWTVVAEDGMPSAHVRHTVAVSPEGADVLTTG
jgi:methionyl aminopeptidase